jgi:hypothetical protein
MITLEATTFLGPASVLKAEGKRFQIDVGAHYCWAQSALAMPYVPAVGDVVLAIGQDDQWYVVGVLSGRGTTTLSVPGDLRIRAPRGTIELSAARGIRMKSPSVKIMADKLELLAKALFESVSEATRWVKETLQLRVGRLRTRVEREYDLKADSIKEKAERDVRIDGQKIHLG